MQAAKARRPVLSVPLGDFQALTVTLHPGLWHHQLCSYTVARLGPIWKVDLETFPLVSMVPAP